MDKSWKIKSRQNGKTMYVQEGTGNVVAHYDNGKISANPYIPFQVVYESPELFIEKSCFKICKALWEKNISTIESGANETKNDYVVLSKKLSDENLQMFKLLARQQPKTYQFKEDHWKFGKNICIINGNRNSELPTQLVDGLKMQDITEGVMSSEVFLIEYCDCKKHKVKGSPPLILTVFDPSKQTKTLMEYLIEKGMENFYIEKEDKVYENQFYLDRHNAYLTNRAKEQQVLSQKLKDIDIQPYPFESIPSELVYGGGTTSTIVDREGFKYIVAEAFLPACLWLYDNNIQSISCGSNKHGKIGITINFETLSDKNKKIAEELIKSGIVEFHEPHEATCFPRNIRVDIDVNFENDTVGEAQKRMLEKTASLGLQQQDVLFGKKSIDESIQWIIELGYSREDAIKGLKEEYKPIIQGETVWASQELFDKHKAFQAVQQGKVEKTL